MNKTETSSQTNSNKEISLLSCIKTNWINFWFADLPLYPIAAFRILFGVYLLVFFLAALPYIDLFFSNQGVYSPFLIPDIAPPISVAWGIYLVSIGLIISFILGYKTKIITPLLLVTFVYHYLLDSAVQNTSYDRMIMLFLGLLCFANLDSVWSISPHRKPVNEESRRISNCIIKILAIQMTLFYTFTGIYKLFMPAWHTGLIIKMTMVSAWGTPFAFWFVNTVNPPIWFYDALTYSLIIFELSCGILFWIKPLQKCIFIIGIVFHISVWFFLDIPQFMICPLTYVLFMPHDEVKVLFEKLFNSLVSIKNNLVLLEKKNLEPGMAN